MESELLAEINGKLYWLLIALGIIAFNSVIRSIFIVRGNWTTEKAKSEDSAFMEMFDKEDYAAVLESSIKKLEKKPSDVQLHWYKGRALFLLERFDEAIPVFEKIRSLEPTWEHHATSYLDRMEQKSINTSTG